MVLALLAATQAAPPTTDAEIVVVAQKMRLIQVDMKAPKRNGKLVLERCDVRRPTGHAEIDAIPCDVARECMQNAPASRKLLESCVEERSQGRLDAVVASWRAARAVQP